MSSSTAQVLKFPEGQSVNYEAKGGFISLHRCLEDEPWAKCPVKRVIWEHLLLNATHKPYKTKLGARNVILQPGQLISGRTQILKNCFDQKLIRVTEDMVRGALNFFKKEGMISVTGTRFGSVITIVKWSKYQTKPGEKSPQYTPQQTPQQKPSNHGAYSEGLPSKTPNSSPTIQEDKTLYRDTNVSLDSSDDETPSVKKVPMKSSFVYPKEFEWIWKHKPEREGANPKRRALSACNARIKQGSTWRELAEGMMRYQQYCQAKGILNTEYVKQMASFFGPDEHFKNSWEINHAPQVNSAGLTGQPRKLSTVDRQHAAAAEYIARLECEAGSAPDASSVVASHE
ncbi:hypothetical protein [Neptuniibacter halophilus]|uniref:hypothetical protein n=1 Tax=Neptuniibacter halophilus TaxID=651666 RepID=UPI002573AABF|nr:hypothetical protein [Neptuniibacter halophilus]